ncbi:MAG: TlpA disulfide reductase family protein [Actinomycetota bacterium]|nr:TlpA disulfide reductase family protein [Actinomycetota bacterium]
MIRWLIPALLVPMLIAGACRGGQSDLSVEQVDETITESVVSGMALDPFESTESDPAVGRLAPSAFGLDLLTGKTVRVIPAGRPLVVAFFAHWCPHCQREVATLTEWLLANKLPGNVDLIAVSTFEAPERGNHPPKKWLSEEGWKHPVVADTSSQAIADAFGAMSVPYFVFIEADGTVAFRMSGNLGPDQLSVAMRRLAGTSI